jgi:hypothetical protein
MPPDKVGTWGCDSKTVIGSPVLTLEKVKFFRSNHDLPELFINCVVSSRREFADGAEFKTRGTRSQIPENLGHVPEFGAPFFPPSLD